MKARRAVAAALVAIGAFMPGAGMAQMGPGRGMGPGMREGSRAGRGARGPEMMGQMSQSSARRRCRSTWPR